MHRLFDVYEVYAYMIDLFYESEMENTPPDLQSFISLALTNKIFLDPCMSNLWSRVRTLTQLFNTLPDDLYEIIPSPSTHKEVRAFTLRRSSGADAFTFSNSAP